MLISPQSSSAKTFGHRVAADQRGGVAFDPEVVDAGRFLGDEDLVGRAGHEADLGEAGGALAGADRVDVTHDLELLERQLAACLPSAPGVALHWPAGTEGPSGPSRRLLGRRPASPRGQAASGGLAATAPARASRATWPPVTALAPPFGSRDTSPPVPPARAHSRRPGLRAARHRPEPPACRLGRLFLPYSKETVPKWKDRPRCPKLQATRATLKSKRTVGRVSMELP